MIKESFDKGNYEKMSGRTIPAPLNKDASGVNADIIERLPRKF